MSKYVRALTELNADERCGYFRVVGDHDWSHPREFIGGIRAPYKDKRSRSCTVCRVREVRS